MRLLIPDFLQPVVDRVEATESRLAWWMVQAKERGWDGFNDVARECVTESLHREHFGREFSFAADRMEIDLFMGEDAIS